jgi:phosphoribosyl 1,2-cyclic phosphodiesterase
MKPGSRNRRNNTSLLIRYAVDDETPIKNIVIDCGKTFYASALEWFPKYHITNVDAMMLTHSHADAVFGLDELREWSTSEKPLDVYLSRETYTTIQHMFPYLVDPKKATGGGKVSVLNFIIFDDLAPRPLEVCGLSILPIRVVHGEQYLSGKTVPFYAFGYRFDDIVYLSDVSAIPEESETSMLGACMLIVDALFDIPGQRHRGHFSVEQALAVIDKYRVNTGILTGAGHKIEHTSLQKKLDELGPIRKQQLLMAYDGMRYEI